MKEQKSSQYWLGNGLACTGYMAAGVVLGILVDNLLNTSPILLIFFSILGISFGIYRLIKLFNL